MQRSVHDQAAGAADPDGAGSGWICFSAQDWWYHNRAHSDFQLMQQLARHAPVLLVNSIGMRMPLPGRSTMPLRRVARKLGSVARHVRRPVVGLPDFHVMTPVIAPFYGSPRARALNARIVRLQVERVAADIGIRHPDVLVTVPTAAPVVREMDHRTLVYNRSDKHSAFGEADAGYISSLELELLHDADHVLYVSEVLMASESEHTGERAVFLDHGVDTEHFVRRPVSDEPADLARIPHPRIGFFGGIDDYVVDLDLIGGVARALPGTQVVLIGDATCSMAPLTELPNVHWLGFRPYDDIPRYGSGFDVAIMPWLANDWIRHSNPIKLKEYLALDLPVVTTPFPGAERYGSLVDVAADLDDFVTAIRRALARPARPGAGRAAVAADTWESKAAVIRRLAHDASAR